jgi:hypothetical protein
MITSDDGSRVKHKNLLDDVPDQLLFFGCFVVGAASIIVLKAASIDQRIVTAVPIALMSIYAGIAVYTRRYRIREDRVGDNLYYLGFLFTLVSLAYALAAYTAELSAIQTIIENFGIALATTIVGLMLRVVFNQMREDPVEYEREARIELADAARAVKSEMAGVAVSMSDFRRQMQQRIEEAMSEASSTTKRTLEQNVESFSRVGTEVIGRINEAFGSFGEQSKRLNDVAAMTVDALETLFNRISRIEASPDLLAMKLDPVIKKFAEVSEEALARGREHAADMKALRRLLDSTMKTAERMKGALEAAETGAATELAEFGRVLSSSSTSAAQLGETLEGMRSKLERGFESHDQAIRDMNEVLGREIEAGRALSEELRRSFQAQSDLTRKASTELMDTIAGDLAAVKRYRTEIEAVLDASTTMLGDVEKALVSLSHVLVEKLNVA